MTDARQAWSDAGQQISALTARLKEAFEQQRAAEALQTGEGPEAGGTSAMPDGAADTGSTAPSQPSGSGAVKAEVQEAVRRLSEAAKNVFEVLGGAAKDPDVKADVKHVGNSVTSAFAATFTEIAEQIRKAASKTPEHSEPASSGLVGVIGIDCRDATEPDPAGGCVAPSALRNPAGGAQPWQLGVRRAIVSGRGQAGSID